MLIWSYLQYPPWNFLYIIKALQCSFTNPKYDVMELEASKNWHLFWAWIDSIENALGKSQFWISWVLQFYRDGSMLTIESNIEVFSLTRSSPVNAIVWFYSQIWGFGFGWLDLSRLSEGFWKRRSRKPLQQQRWLSNYFVGGTSQKIEWQWPHWKVECRNAQVIVIQFFWAFEWIKWRWHPLQSGYHGKVLKCRNAQVIAI